MASGESCRSSRYLFPQITAVCSVPDGFAGARSLSQAFIAIWPWRWRNAQLGTSRFCLTQAKTQTRSELKDPFIIMGVALPHRPPEVEVGQTGPSSKQPEPTCSSYGSPPMNDSAENTFIQPQLLRGISTAFLWSTALLVFIDWREIFFLSASGGGAADDYRLRERGQPLRHGRSLLWGEVSNDSTFCRHGRRRATLGEVGPSVQGQAVTLYAVCIILFMTRGSPWCSQL